MITLKSISLPLLLILAIELAIQMNMAVPFYINQTYEKSFIGYEGNVETKIKYVIKID